MCGYRDKTKARTGAIEAFSARRLRNSRVWVNKPRTVLRCNSSSSDDRLFPFRHEITDLFFVRNNLRHVTGRVKASSAQRSLIKPPPPPPPHFLTMCLKSSRSSGGGIAAMITRPSAQKERRPSTADDVISIAEQKVTLDSFDRCARIDFMTAPIINATKSRKMNFLVHRQFIIVTKSAR